MLLLSNLAAFAACFDDRSTVRQTLAVVSNAGSRRHNRNQPHQPGKQRLGRVRYDPLQTCFPSSQSRCSRDSGVRLFNSGIDALAYCVLFAVASSTQVRSISTPTMQPGRYASPSLPPCQSYLQARCPTGQSWLSPSQPPH